MRKTEQVLRAEGPARLRAEQVAALAVAAVALVSIVGVGSAGSSARVGGPSRLVGSQAYAGDLLAVLLGLGLCVAGLLAYVLWPSGRRRQDDDEAAPESPPTSLVSKVVAVASLLLLVAALVLVVTHLPGSHYSPPTSAISSTPSGVSPPGASPVSSKPPTPRTELAQPDWWLPLGLAIVGLAAIAFALVRRGLRSRGEAPAAPAASDPLGEAIALSLEDVEREPDPRRAVIKAYARMEKGLETHGLPRRPFETSFEYLPRALASRQVSARPVERLTALFVRAKFSPHKVDERMRAQALAALTVVRDELTVRS